MEPRGVGTGWLCIAVLCSGAAFILQDEEPRRQSTTQYDDVSEPRGHPTTIPGDVDNLTTGPTVTPTPPWTRDPITTPMVTQAGNESQKASAVPIRYWSPAIFVVVALLVLFFTYRRTKGEGSRDPATSASDSSDLGALDHIPTQDTTPIIPAPQEERKGLKNSPALGHTETTFCESDPPPPQLLPPQPDAPTAHHDSGCSGEFSAD